MRKFLTASIAALAFAGTVLLGTAAHAPMAGEGPWPQRSAMR